jgi:hypothetical protein
MDGKTLLKYGEEGLGGIDIDDKKFFFDCLDAAVTDFVRRTRTVTSSKVITTIEDQQAYNLPPNFIELYAKGYRRRLLGKYSDGTNTYWPVLTSYEKIFRADLTDSKDYPGRFAIIDKQEKDDIVEGTATADGNPSAGEIILEDSAASFESTVNARDIIHNTPDGSDGIVLSVTDDTHLKCALFNGADNEFVSGNAYVSIPACNNQVYLDAPSKTAGHTLTLPYVCMPSPIYSDYGFWRFPAMSCRAICYEAAYLYKVDYDFDGKRDKHLHDLFEDEIKNTNIETARRRLQGGRYTERS